MFTSGPTGNRAVTNSIPIGSLLIRLRTFAVSGFGTLRRSYNFLVKNAIYSLNRTLWLCL